MQLKIFAKLKATLHLLNNEYLMKGRDQEVVKKYLKVMLLEKGARANLLTKAAFVFKSET